MGANRQDSNQTEDILKQLVLDRRTHQKNGNI